VGDDESRREDARQEVLIDRAIRDGKIMYCHHCGDQDWIEWVEVYAYPAEPVPLCRGCAKEYEARY
jgi:hypothetical protein